MKLVLLGSTGFVGRAVLRQADLKSDVGVNALVRSPDREVSEQSDVCRVNGTLKACPQNLFPKEPFVLVHLASKQIDRDNLGFECNVDNIEVFLTRLPRHCRGIIYGSSMSVYGAGSQKSVNEHSLCRPDTRLAKSRLAVERLIQRYAKAHNIWSFSLRPRFIVGDGDRHFMPGLKKALAKGLRVGSGRQRFSIIDVDDYATVIIRLSEHILKVTEAKQLELNVGYESSISMTTLESLVMGDASARALRIPVFSLLNRIIRKLIPASESFIEKISLLGLSHSADVKQLKKLIGADLVDQNPTTKMRFAIDRMAI